MGRPANPELVDRIVRVTARIIDEHGIDGVTIRRVAEEARCSPTVIYHHFGSKDGLLHSAIRQGLEWFGEHISMSERGLHGVERVKASSRAFVQWGISNPSMYRLMFEQRLPRPAEGAELERRRSGLAGAQAMLGDVLGESAGEVDAAQAANMMFVSLHGIVSTTISGRLWGPGLDERRQAELSIPLTDAMVKGLARVWGLEG